MAIMLQPYNTIALSGAPEQLVAGVGHWYIQVLNNGPGSLLIAQSQAALVSSSFTLGAQLSLTPFVWGPDGLWVEGSGSISVALIPNTGTGAPTGAGAVVGPGGGAGSQTPWASNIDGASRELLDAGAIGIGSSAPIIAGPVLWATIASGNYVATLENTNAAGAATLTLFNNYSNSFTIGMAGSGVVAPRGGNAYLNSSNDIVIQRSAIEGMRFSYLGTLAGNIAVGIKQPSPQYSLDIVGDCNITGAYRANGAAGVSGTFTSQDGFTITVANGIITGIA